MPVSQIFIFLHIPKYIQLYRHMLRKIRVVLAAIFFTCITLLFLDFTGTLHAWFGWMAKIQFFPAILALNAGVVIILMILTLVFGRVYCSVICPLGVFQDIVSWINGKRGKKHRMRFRYSPAKSWLRYGVLVLFIAALVAGIGSFVALLDPYSAYGRIVSNLFAPLYQWGNNLLAYISERADSYAFYSKDVWDMVQHHLPCGHSARMAVQVFPVCNKDRRREMRILQTVLPCLQGFMHRLRTPQDRLQQVRIMHGLHRFLLQRGDSLRSPVQGQRETNQGSGDRHFTPGIPDSICHSRRISCSESSGEKSRRWACRNRGQGHPEKGDSNSPSRCRKYTTFLSALHCMPALRLRMSQ